MNYILHGARRSGSLAVELALAEIGVGHEVVDVDLDRDAQRDEAYAAVNPQRKVPALITPDGETLTESAAILLTLAERHPGAGLLPPAGSAARARALRWLMFVATEIYPLVEINDYPERFSSDAAVAPALREVVRGRWRERWLIVEAHVDARPFALGADFGLLDIYLAVVSRWAQQDDWRPANLPLVERITASVAARPACAPVWRRHRPADPPVRFT